MSISIIIPVLNEEKNISRCLNSLPAEPDLEILVVDGGSTDRTASFARASACTFLCCPPGRGAQQHTGAKAAGGDILLFLHCDTRLPKNFKKEIKTILGSEQVSAGAFRLLIQAEGAGFRIIERGVNLRSSLLQLPYGDQALFMRRNTYFTVGGFHEQPLLEDIDLVTRLKKKGKIVLSDKVVRTSARRWHQRGIVQTLLMNQLVLLGWKAGIAPERLARWYYTGK